MRVVILRFFSLSAENVGVEVIWSLGIVYAVLLLVSLSSVWSIRMSALGKVAWSLLVVAVPVAGMAIYCFWTLLNSDFDYLKVFGLGVKAKHPRG